MTEGLCWKCREKFGGMYDSHASLKDFPFFHCHHSPKEKEKCWCEDEYRKINLDCGYRGKLRLNEVLIEMHFCPQCGSKLGDKL